MNNEFYRHSLKLENEDYYYKRLSDDTFFLKKDFAYLKNKESIDVTGSKALIGTGRVKNGSFCFKTTRGEVHSQGEVFGLYIPPYSIYKTSFNFEQSELAFVSSSRPEIISGNQYPLIFPTQIESFTGTEEQISGLLKEMAGIRAVCIINDTAPEADAAKKIIDDQYAEINKVSAIAERLGLESWELSRIFKQSYGISPLKYLNNLRTIEAIYRILRDGKRTKIIDVAFNVGFRDLSRFNKQFRSFVRFIPRNLFTKDD